MHKQAIGSAQKFITDYLSHLIDKDTNILDVGSLNMNGTLKSLFVKNNWKYQGVDIMAGNNVDTVLKDPYEFPFPDDTFDVIVSSSCFEHNEMFWLTFKEMVRVTKSGGFMCISAPFKDGIHPAPVDCWRFLPDGYRALTKWCPESKLLESYITPRPARDCVGIFKVEK